MDCRNFRIWKEEWGWTHAFVYVMYYGYIEIPVKLACGMVVVDSMWMLWLWLSWLSWSFYYCWEASVFFISFSSGFSGLS
jgi:hypothetical protein